MTTLQPQECVLSPAALRSLDDLKRSAVFNDRLQTRLQKAVELITDISEKLNDRGREEAVRYEKKRNRLIANGESADADADTEARQDRDDYQEKVEALTKKMDLSIRKVIDDQIWLQGIPNALDHVRQKAANVRRTTSTQATTQQTENSVDMDNSDEEDYSTSLVRPDSSDAPTALLDAAFGTNQTKWQSKSLTEKYSEHNNYVGWYRMVYDAKHAGEHAPPMPHASMWFATEENRDTTTVQRGSQNRGQQRQGNNRNTRNNTASHSDSESDVEIAAERIRIRCPITLRPYKDPLASTKCPHAFEKSAILDMFKHTSNHVPFTPEELAELSQISRTQDRQRREKQLKVPVVRCPECSAPLTEKDLRPDPVLLRRVNRILEKERRAEEAEQQQEADIDDDGDDDENEFLRGSQRRRIVHLGSSPAISNRRQSGRVVKNERLSMVPGAED